MTTWVLQSPLLILFLLYPALLYAQNKPEQKPPQVWELEITGNQTFSDVVIKEQIAADAFSLWEKTHLWDRKGHPLNELTIKKDSVRILRFYKRRGFPSARVRYDINNKEEWKRHVVFSIEEGAPILIKNIDFIFSDKRFAGLIKTSEAFKEARRESELQIGARYESVKKVEAENAFVQALKKTSFAYANVEISAVTDTVAHIARLTVFVQSGPLTYISNIAVQGESTLSEPYILRESGLELGTRYDTEKISEAQRRLFDHPLINFVTIRIPDQHRDSTLTLAIRIREKKTRTIELSAGFSTEEYIRGRVSWVHRNAFGKAHRFSITAKASFIEQFLGADYLFPYAFNTKSSFLLSPFVQHVLRPGYELFQWGITNSLIYRYNRDLTAFLSYQFTQNDEVSRRFEINLPDTAKMYDLSSIQLSALYSKGLRLIERGWVIQPFVQISGFFNTSDYQFQELSLDLRRYMPLTNSTTLALRVQAAKIFATQEDSLPRSVRLYLGGSNSVRGWGRNELSPKIAVYKNDKGQRVPAYIAESHFERFIPVGGRTSFAFNIEIRQDLYSFIKGFGFVIFLDGGQVWRRAPDVVERPLQFGAGGGLRYRSPIGPVRLDVGYKLNPSNADLGRINGADYGTVWERFGIYISVGQAF